MCLVVIPYASFSNAKKLRSQLVFVIMMMDEKGTANVIHYGSRRCRRAMRSIIAAKSHPLVIGFDNSFVTVLAKF